MLYQLLFALSIRFFLFDFVLFKPIREFLKKKGYFFRKLFGCPFCQGFWCGLGVFFYNNPDIQNWQQLITFVSFGFISAYLGLVAAVALHPLIERFEQDSDIPLR